jgi:LPS sulfotransferase NodH
MKKFIILTTQRSGSTLLWRYLNGHPNISAHGEMFLPNHSGSDTYASFRKSSRAKWLRHYVANKRNLNAYFGEFFFVAQNIEACGFKLMYNQISQNLSEWIKQHDVSIIHLIRKNILKTIVSRETNRVRGVAHITANETVDKIKVYLDADKLIPSIAKIERMIELQTASFSALPYMEVIYEDFTKDPACSAESIFDFLGVSRIRGLEMPLKKINPDKLEDVIENYAEVKLRLSDQPYSKFLD